MWPVNWNIILNLHKISVLILHVCYVASQLKIHHQITYVRRLWNAYNFDSTYYWFQVQITTVFVFKLFVFKLQFTLFWLHMLWICCYSWHAMIKVLTGAEGVEIPSSTYAAQAPCLVEDQYVTLCGTDSATSCSYNQSTLVPTLQSHEHNNAIVQS